MDATYVSVNSFTVVGDRTSEFVTDRRVKLDCGMDGIKYTTVISGSYSSPNTTVTIDESTLTSNLSTALYGIVQPGEYGSLPDHSHDGSEGSGGTSDHSALNQLNYASAGHTGFVSSVDLSTTSGSLQTQIDGKSDVDHTHSTFSGTSIHVDGDATVTGTMYAHTYDSYSPLVLKAVGKTVAIGDESTGVVDFPYNPTYDGSELFVPSSYNVAPVIVDTQLNLIPDSLTEYWGDNPKCTHTGAIHDAFIYQNAPTNKYGDSAYISVGMTTTSTRTYRGLVKSVNLSTDSTLTASGIQIHSAKLWLYLYTDSGVAIDIVGYRILQSWIELQTHWINRYDYNAWKSSGCSTTSDSQPEDGTADRKATEFDRFTTAGVGWYYLNVTDLVTGWVNGSISEYGFLLKSASEGTLNTKKNVYVFRL